MSSPPLPRAFSCLALSRLAVALLAALSGACGLFARGAGTGAVSGRILNQGTGEYLRNAVVTVVGPPLGTTAGAGGAYALAGVPAGVQRLRFTFEGLDAKEESVAVVAGQTATLDVALSSAVYGDVIKLSQFVVASEREGNAKAIMEQKNSIESRRVPATDTFGSISEGNVGEFLKYLRRRW